MKGPAVASKSAGGAQVSSPIAQSPGHAASRGGSALDAAFTSPSAASPSTPVPPLTQEQLLITCTTLDAFLRRAASMSTSFTQRGVMAGIAWDECERALAHAGYSVKGRDVQRAMGALTGEAGDVPTDLVHRARALHSAWRAFKYGSEHAADDASGSGSPHEVASQAAAAEGAARRAAGDSGSVDTGPRRWTAAEDDVLCQVMEHFLSTDFSVKVKLSHLWKACVDALAASSACGNSVRTSVGVRQHVIAIETDSRVGGTEFRPRIMELMTSLRVKFSMAKPTSTALPHAQAQADSSKPTKEAAGGMDILASTDDEVPREPAPRRRTTRASNALVTSSDAIVGASSALPIPGLGPESASLTQAAKSATVRPFNDVLSATQVQTENTSASSASGRGQDSVLWERCMNEASTCLLQVRRVIERCSGAYRAALSLKSQDAWQRAQDQLGQVGSTIHAAIDAFNMLLYIPVPESVPLRMPGHAGLKRAHDSITGSGTTAEPAIQAIVDGLDALRAKLEDCTLTSASVASDVDAPMKPMVDYVSRIIACMKVSAWYMVPETLPRPPM